MSILLDWILIFISFFIFIRAYKNIVFVKNCSIANYVVIILFVFCVVPIILNYIMGIPTYNTTYWYKPFIAPMENETVNVIYDIYMLLCFLFLYFPFAKKKKNVELKNENSLTSILRNNKIFSFLLISSPIFLIILTNTWKNYLVFNVAASRGFSENANTSFMTPCLLVSLITFFATFYKGKISLKKILLSFLYFFVIVWISGKRFMIANIIVLFIFYVVNMNLNNKTRKRIFKMIPVLGVLLVAFSAFYLIRVRPLSDTSFDSVYEMLRVDFGRDDVIKYVINEEIIKDNRILDYRGQSFIALIASFIPRKIWSNKPYPHYMYLTASILSLDIFDLPAGTTPSLLEMTICNFGKFGFLIGILLLPLLCLMIDKCKDIDSKAIMLILFVVLLTQSMDVYLIAIVFYVAIKIFTTLFKNKSVKFVWK